MVAHVQTQLTAQTDGYFLLSNHCLLNYICLKKKWEMLKRFHNLIRLQVFIHQALHDHKAIFCSNIADLSQRKALCMQTGQKLESRLLLATPIESNRARSKAKQPALTQEHHEDKADRFFHTISRTLSYRNTDKVASHRY